MRLERNRFAVGAAIALVLLAGGEPAAASPALFAERISERTDPRRLPGGPDAVAGEDDWALGNGTLCAVVSDPSHENDLSTTGGTLMDLGHCGRGDDQFLVYEQLFDLSPRRLATVSRVAARVGDDGARVVATAERQGIAVETTYFLDGVEPARLRLTTRLRRESVGASVGALGLAYATVGSLRPFTRTRTPSSDSRGFRRVGFFGKGLRAAVAAAEVADGAVLVGEDRLEPGIAYGPRLLRAELQRASGERVALPHFVLADGMATITAVFVRPFWVGNGRSLGWLQLLQSRWMDLAPGDTLLIEQEIRVGERADVASVTDPLAASEPRVSGRVDDPAARIHVEGVAGGAVSEVRPDEDGAFALRLGRGRYVARVAAPGDRSVRREFEVGADDVELGPIALPPPARLRLPRGRPLRLVFRGEGETPDPRFGDDLLGYAVVGERDVRRTAAVNDLSLDGSEDDPIFVVVAPGTYRVWATRGPEFEVAQTRVAAIAGETVSLTIPVLRRAVETPGWISSDLHVHAAPSPDSALPQRDRLASFVAQGAEVLVATEHDMISDYAPLIARSGLSGSVTSVVGVEVTSEVASDVAPYTIGHANAFPVEAIPFAYRRGAPANEGRRWRDVIADLRGRSGERVIQLNHARSSPGKLAPRSFFSHLGAAGRPYEPSLPLTAEPNRILLERDAETGFRDIDFDAMELLNGKRMQRYPALRDDWFSLLRQGVVLTATANSDSHTLQRVVAVPRSYVFVADDRIESFDEDAFVAAIRSQRVFGTTGPILAVELGGAGIGERFSGRTGLLRVEVRSAAWVPVDEVRVYVDGEQVVAQPASAGDVMELPLRFARDGFVTVEVSGEARNPYAEILPGFAPFAFSNPIFVDADADGRWDPRGRP